jgi:hypothetical protein
MNMTDQLPVAQDHSRFTVAAPTGKDLDDVFRLSKALAMSGDMIPKHFQNQPEAIMAALLRGREVGLAPMQALSAIAVINGRATIWGDALPALMQRAGHHVDVQLEGAGDDLTAVATLTRGDTGKVVIRRFSMADAKRAGLLGKPGPWQQYPQRMLALRARAWAIRDGAADALMGLSVAEYDETTGPEAARNVTPRRGGAVYIADDPEVDEIIEHDDGPSAADLARAEAEARAAARAAEDGM